MESVRHAHVVVISDVDECSADTAVCGTGAECINLNGSFSCLCLVGFQKTGNNCTGLIISLNLCTFYLPLRPNNYWVTKFKLAVNRCPCVFSSHVLG